ncbi:hypothetical protein PG985_012663 [Apiospora marii]|uniref:uncharacterized protein n=1 Tax=Apiospora marii TaxID=335849 RepID=UPI00312F1937
MVVSIVDQLKHVIHSSNPEPAINSTLPNSSSEAGTQTNEANPNSPMSNSYLQDSMERIEENDAIIREYKSTVEEYKAKIEKLERDNETMQQKWNEAEIQLHEARQHQSNSYAQTEVIDDDYITEQTDLLRDHIQDVASLYFSGGPWKTHVKTDTKGVFDKLTPGWTSDYLKSGVLKPYFIEAVIWHHIIDKILNHPMTIWCKILGEGLLDLHKNIWHEESSIKHEAYHSMRVHVAEASLQVHGRNGYLIGDRDTASENKKMLVDKLVERLEKFTHNIKACRKEFELIIERAVGLAYSMTMAKAHYVIRLGDNLYAEKYHGFHSKAKSMEAIYIDEDEDWVNLPEPGKVHLVATPAVIRYGTSEGEAYKEGKVLAKARIIQG